MNLLAKLVAFVLFLGLLVPGSVLAQNAGSNVDESTKSAGVEIAGKVDSFELFWPIVAGKVKGEPLYFLKSLKENLRGALIFSELKKAEYAMTLSEKRTVEVERLLVVNKDYQNAKLSLDAAQQKRQKAVEVLRKAEAKGRNISDQKNRIIVSFEKQRKLLNYLATQIPEEQKAIIENNISQLDSTLAAM